MTLRFRLAGLLIALLLLAAPGLALARAGGGGSMGSRGGYTYSAPPSTPTAPGGGQMMNRSLTPQTPYQSPGYAGGASRPGMFGGGFGSGLMGGLLGAGLVGMLFGHGFFGGGFGFGGLLGLVVQIMLVVWGVRWLLRRFAGTPSFAGAGGMARGMMGGPTPGPAGGPVGGGGGGPAAVPIGPADYQAFEQALQQIQAAWSAHDIAGLQGLATPEMVSYFAEQLAGQASRGVRNSVTDVRLERGDLAQAWAEPGRDYATVAMRFSMIDVTTDMGGRVVDGSPTEHVAATELWTFVRAPAGRWILSAIQQAR